MDHQNTLMVKLLRGLDNGMPGALRPVWNKVTPGFQQMKSQEMQRQHQEAEMMRQHGADGMGDMKAEYDQYRRARQN